MSKKQIAELKRKIAILKGLEENTAIPEDERAAYKTGRQKLEAELATHETSKKVVKKKAVKPAPEKQQTMRRKKAKKLPAGGIKKKSEPSEVSKCREIIAAANKAARAKKGTKPPAKRRDATIIKDRVKSVYTTITKELDTKKPDDKKTATVVNKIGEVVTTLHQAIDKLSAERDVSGLNSIFTGLKKLV